MDIDKFFKQLDPKIAEQQDALKGKTTARERNDAQAERIVQAAGPIIEQYAAQLCRRGINVTWRAVDRTLLFQFDYKNGDRSGFELRPEYSKTPGSPEVTYRFHRFVAKGSSVGGGPPTDETWDPVKFEEYVQQTIERAVADTSQSGGHCGSGLR